MTGALAPAVLSNALVQCRPRHSAPGRPARADG
jgi:hypothetical protein